MVEGLKRHPIFPKNAVILNVELVLLKAVAQIPGANIRDKEAESCDY
jgi:hypothetical protein